MYDLGDLNHSYNIDSVDEGQNDKIKINCPKESNKLISVKKMPLKIMLKEAVKAHFDQISGIMTGAG